ncbi:molybdopterin molybdotransferase MoeA [Candidatus Thioglobus autotrophicus]|uniref:molybdopterin molybdotransferase MoeA n=1 Tax=Candidatus Thioglobus autotrophicus TaxID=1705394 RepID=UPI0006B53796|nr:gephyrin-like molybdotransferase Glp [Candidatus Thioglobus autotrophicus]WPE16992.1 molybdopterin molybdotransferase MoeA [Candidatus Thioglobus autotrophicus]WPE18547.1 molybdopterin molybdotransferase MoeA [Candidatus Thioglobus autotrophicus]
MSDQNTECGCDEIPQPLLSTDQALATLTNAAKVISTTESLELDEALGRVLSADIQSNINVPGFDNSAMDGYAIHLQEEQINKPGALSFTITGRIPAGMTGAELQPGCAARIFTGAPIPQGANTVIMQEECEVSEEGNSIETWRPLSLNENIRPMGNDIQSGDTILAKGITLKAQDIALAASVGISTLAVFKKIKVGIFFTGDELVKPGDELRPGQIYDSNRYALVAMLNNLGCDIINLQHIKDTLDDTISALNSLQNQCDLIITTGGVSVGEEDHVKPAVEQLGQLNLWRIKMKPGKPLAFGQIGQSAFIGLPGNPVSAMVTFLLFARPFIKKTQGCANYLNTHFKVAVDFDWHRPKPRREFVRVKLDQSTLPATVNQYPKQGSDVLSSMVWADGFAEIPEDTVLKSGELVNFYPLNTMML